LGSQRERKKKAARPMTDRCDEKEKKKE